MIPPPPCTYLCSRSVACISHTRTRERRFLSSVQFSDMQMLPMVWASSRSRDAFQTGKTGGHGQNQAARETENRSQINPERLPHFPAPFCPKVSAYLLLGVVGGPALDMLDQVLVEVGGERGGEGAGGP